MTSANAFSSLHEPVLAVAWCGTGLGAEVADLLEEGLAMTPVSELPAIVFYDEGDQRGSETVVRSGYLPHSRLLAWRDPGGQHDFLLFTGDVHPRTYVPLVCERLLDLAERLGIRTAYTFGSLDGAPEESVHQRTLERLASGHGIDIVHLPSAAREAEGPGAVRAAAVELLERFSSRAGISLDMEAIRSVGVSVGNDEF